MTKNYQNIAIRIALTIIPLVLSLFLTALLISLLDKDPVAVFENAWDGAFADQARIVSVFNFWIPLTIRA